MKKILLAFLVSICCISAFAHHIVGGEIIYEYLGPGSTANSRQYRITLKLFRDQNCVQPCAAMPLNVYIGIYNKDDNSEFNACPPTVYCNVPKSDEQSVPVNPFPPCITNPPLLDYHVGIYTLIVDLPNNNNGYTVSYQTCCRVDNPNNVSNPGGGVTGATYTTDIPAVQDNCAFFDTKVDVICQNKPFTLDFGATDADGDSLVYFFVPAYIGSDGTTASANINPTAPPYSSVPYINGYTGLQPLGNQATINPRTGIISGIAPSSGPYVVCVAVRSYRNGQFITEHRKDFIVNIGNCDFAGAQLDPLPVTCDGFNVSFKNANSSALDTSFYWTFGDPRSGANNTSTSKIPTHTYTDTGAYTVKLVVNRGSPCADSATVIAKVYPGFFPGFTTLGQCKNTQIQFTDTTKTNYGFINSWSWDFGDQSTLADTSHIKNPKYLYNVAGIYDVTFTVANSKGCSATIMKPITITDKPSLQVTNDTLICSIDTLQLNAYGNGSFLWTPNYNINNQTSAAPLVSPKNPFTYYVKLTDPFGCQATDSVFVNVKQFVTVDAGPDLNLCGGDTIQIQSISDALHYKWSPSNLLLNDTAKQPLALPPRTTKFYVIANIGKCQSTDSMTIHVTPYPVKTAKIDSLICYGETIQLHASGGSIYNWSPPFFLNNPSIPDPFANPTRSIQYVVSISDTLGCPKSVKDTITVMVDRVFAEAGPHDTSMVINQPLQLNGAGSQFYLWSPAGWLNNPAIPNPVAVFNIAGNYQLILTTSNLRGCSATDTMNVHVYTVKPGIYVPNAFTPNGNGLNDIFKPFAIGIKQINYFKVYNRWGQLIFSSTDQSMGWDGTFKGRAQDAAVYVWIVEAVDYADNKITQKGIVTLIR